MNSRVLGSALVVACLSGCGGAVGDAVRPADYTGQGALGAAGPTCTGSPRAVKPLIIDLEPDSRVDLEATMKKGLVVVSYDCKSLRVLSTCKMPDTAYDYAGVSRKEQVVQLKSQDDLAVNLPLSSGKLGTEVQSGRSIDLALVLVGRRSTLVGGVERKTLTGNCEGATHFVHSASVGAFSMATGSAGKAAVVGELFSVGASAKSEASRKAVTTDGSLDACRKSDPDAPSPPAECRAPLRVELLPIEADAAAPASGTKKAEAAHEAKAAENPCPAGFQFADGICTKTPSQAFLCNPKDRDECKAQCEKGNAESCYNFALGLKKDKAAVPFHKKACEGGVGDACGFLVGDDPQEAIRFAKMGCDLGSGFSCSMMAIAYDNKNDAKGAFRANERACALGEALACKDASLALIEGAGTKKDIARGLELMARTCQGGPPDWRAAICVDLAEMLSSGENGVPKDPARAIALAKKACDADGSVCSGALDIAVAQKNDAEAFAMATRGCADATDIDMCLKLGDFYAKGVGTKADAARAKELWEKNCKDGNEDACARLGKKAAPTSSGDSAAPPPPAAGKKSGGKGPKKKK